MSIAKLFSTLVDWLRQFFGSSGPATITAEPAADTPITAPAAKITAVYLTGQGANLDREMPNTLAIGRKSRLFVNITKTAKTILRISTYIDGTLQDNAVMTGSPNDDPGDARRKAYLINSPGTNGYPIGPHTLRITIAAISGPLDSITIPVDVLQAEPRPGDE